MTNKYILAISGNDIFSGGGLYADLATYTTNHLHGFLAVTCLTALTENGFDVFAYCLPGHGEDTCNIRCVSYDDWIEFAQEKFLFLKNWREI